MALKSLRNYVFNFAAANRSNQISRIRFIEPHSLQGG
jgi:hypothetical protein